MALRARLARAYGLDQYKEFWRAEVVRARSAPPLPQLVRRWAELRRAFLLRHRLVHGARSYTAAYAAPKVAVLLEAAADIRAFCGAQSIDLHAWLPVRRAGDHSTS